MNHITSLLQNGMTVHPRYGLIRLERIEGLRLKQVAGQSNTVYLTSGNSFDISDDEAAFLMTFATEGEDDA